MTSDQVIANMKGDFSSKIAV